MMEECLNAFSLTRLLQILGWQNMPGVLRGVFPFYFAILDSVFVMCYQMIQPNETKSIEVIIIRSDDFSSGHRYLKLAPLQRDMFFQERCFVSVIFSHIEPTSEQKNPKVKVFYVMRPWYSIHYKIWKIKSDMLPKSTLGNQVMS